MEVLLNRSLLSFRALVPVMVEYLVFQMIDFCVGVLSSFVDRFHIRRINVKVSMLNYVQVALREIIRPLGALAGNLYFQVPQTVVI